MSELKCPYNQTPTSVMCCHLLQVQLSACCSQETGSSSVAQQSARSLHGVMGEHSSGPGACSCPAALSPCALVLQDLVSCFCWVATIS